jgi:uncharacterized protein YndB with AHSA1/START domain
MTSSTTSSIAYDAFFPHPIDRVWRVLTDAKAIEQWLMPNTFEPRLGHQFTFQAPPIPAANFDGVVRCEVTELEPPHRLAYTWRGGTLDTLVTYDLEAASEGGTAGTRLRFEQSGFDLSRPADQMAYNGMSDGWRRIVGPGLGAVLDQLAGGA